MENNDKTVLSEQPIGKEYQIPELVNLSIVGEAKASCGSGSSGAFCISGAVVDV